MTIPSALRVTSAQSGFGGLGVSVLAWRKNPQHAFLRKGSKAVGPMSQDLRHVKDP
jgi:hypothetical protein